MSPIGGLVITEQTNKRLEQLYSLCSEGDLTELQNLSGGMNLWAQKAHVKLRCFRLACKYGHLDIAKWLDGKFKIMETSRSEDDISWSNLRDFERDDGTLCTFYLVKYGAYSFFKTACVQGQLEVAKWLLENKAIDPSKSNIKHQIYMASLFVYVSRCGQLEVAKWLLERFKIFYDYKYPIGAEALYEICGSYQKKNTAKISDDSRIQMIQWLNSNIVKLDDTIVLRALHKACEYGHLEVVKYFVERFNLNSEQIKNNKNHAFVRACVREHYEIAKWLRYNFDIIDDELRENNYLFDCIKHHDDINFKKWVAINLRFSPEKMIDMFNI